MLFSTLLLLLLGATSTTCAINVPIPPIRRGVPAAPAPPARPAAAPPAPAPPRPPTPPTAPQPKPPTAPQPKPPTAPQPIPPTNPKPDPNRKPNNPDDPDTPDTPDGPDDGSKTTARASATRLPSTPLTLQTSTRTEGQRPTRTQNSYQPAITASGTRMQLDTQLIVSLKQQNYEKLLLTHDRLLSQRSSWRSLNAWSRHLSICYHLRAFS
jgi:hypothetical protein